jgi:hypothetical protein
MPEDDTRFSRSEQTMRVRGARQQVAMKIGAMVLLLVVGAAIMLTLGNGGG